MGRALLRSRVIVVALLLATAAVAPSTAQAHAFGCDPAGSKTLKETKQVRIYKAAGKFYGCRYATGRSYELWVRKATKRLRHIRLEGPYVAYAYYAEPANCDWWRVGARSFNLRTGRRGRRIHSVGCGDIIRYKVTDLVLRGNGSLAIIRFRHDLEDEEETSYHEVIKADTDKQKVLDSQGLGSYDEDGEDIVWVPNPQRILQESLEYAKGKVSWQRVDGPQSAPLN